MAASRLPLEIQQQIFSTLDSKSFHNARSVCRNWRFASIGSFTLRQHLRRLPIRRTVERQQLNPLDLDLLFSQAAYRLFFGLIIREESSVAGVIHPSCRLPVRPRTAVSRDGMKFVALNNKDVTLFDVSGVSPTAIVQIPLHNLRDLPVGCPGLRPSGSAQHHLALSSNGRLLAVALDRTIQIYDLSSRDSRRLVTRHIADASTHGIARVDFDQNDHLLRVQFTGVGDVLYLGSPGMDERIIAEFSHWNSDCGLKHTFMDSSRLSVATDPADRIHFSGVQLLRSIGDGFLFAAQRHGGRTSSRYLLGCLRCATNPYTSTKSVEHASVIEFIALESFLSSRDLAMTELANIGMGSWDSMPSAHESPQFALCEDLLVVTERDKNSNRLMPHWTQLFLYRVPNEQKIASILRRADSRKERLVASEATVREHHGDFIAAIPLCVGAIAGEVRDIQIDAASENDGPCRILTVRSEEATKMWSLVG